MTDNDLWNMWCDLGERLHRESPEIFADTFRLMLSAFEHVPAEYTEPTLDNWSEMGKRLVVHARPLAEEIIASAPRAATRKGDPS